MADNIEDMIVNVRAETVTAEKNIARLTKEMTKLQKKQENYKDPIGKPAQKNAQAVSYYAAQIKGLTAQINALNVASRVLGTSSKSLTVALGGTVEQSKAQKAAAIALQQSYGISASASKNYASSTNTVTAALKGQAAKSKDQAEANQVLSRSYGIASTGVQKYGKAATTVLDGLEIKQKSYLALMEKINKREAVITSLKKQRALAVATDLNKFDNITKRIVSSITKENAAKKLGILADLKAQAVNQKRFGDAQRIQVQIDKATAAINKQTAAVKKNTTAKKESHATGSGTSNGVAGFWDTMIGQDKDGNKIGTSFGHKIATTAQYASAGSGIYALVGAFKAAGAAALEFDASARRVQAVLGQWSDGTKLTLDDTKQLGKQLEELSKQLGGSISEINTAAITLGRAGVGFEDLAAATEVVTRMAMLTGDTIADSSSAIASYTQVFKDAGTTVYEFGNQLGYAANKSRLSTQDIGTFSNYALAASKSIGITSEQVLGLATAFSNFGLNASTIGTQIRKLAEMIKTETAATDQFFMTLGTSQSFLLDSLQAGGERGKEALTAFINDIGEMSQQQYNAAVSKLPLLQKNVIDTIRKTGTAANKHIAALFDSATNNSLAEADKMALGYQKMWERMVNTALTASTEIADNALTNLFSNISDTDFTATMDEFEAAINGVAGAIEGIIYIGSRVLAVYASIKIVQSALSVSTGLYAGALKTVSLASRSTAVLTATLSTAFKGQGVAAGLASLAVGRLAISMKGLAAAAGPVGIALLAVYEAYMALDGYLEGKEKIAKRNARSDIEATFAMHEFENSIIGTQEAMTHYDKVMQTAASNLEHYYDSMSPAEIEEQSHTIITAAAAFEKYNKQLQNYIVLNDGTTLSAHKTIVGADEIKNMSAMNKYLKEFSKLSAEASAEAERLNTSNRASMEDRLRSQNIAMDDYVKKAVKRSKFLSDATELQNVIAGDAARAKLYVAEKLVEARIAERDAGNDKKAVEAAQELKGLYKDLETYLTNKLGIQKNINESLRTETDILMARAELDARQTTAVNRYLLAQQGATETVIERLRAQKIMAEAAAKATSQAADAAVTKDAPNGNPGLNTAATEAATKVLEINNQITLETERLNRSIALIKAQTKVLAENEVSSRSGLLQLEKQNLEIARSTAQSQFDKLGGLEREKKVLEINKQIAEKDKQIEISRESAVEKNYDTLIKIAKAHLDVYRNKKSQYDLDVRLKEIAIDLAEATVTSSQAAFDKLGSKENEYKLLQAQVSLEQKLLALEVAKQKAATKRNSETRLLNSIEDTINALNGEKKSRLQILKTQQDSNKQQMLKAGVKWDEVDTLAKIEKHYKGQPKLLESIKDYKKSELAVMNEQVKVDNEVIKQGLKRYEIEKAISQELLNRPMATLTFDTKGTEAIGADRTLNIALETEKSKLAILEEQHRVELSLLSGKEAAAVAERQAMELKQATQAKLFADERAHLTHTETLFANRLSYQQQSLDKSMNILENSGLEASLTTAISKTSKTMLSIHQKDKKIEDSKAKLKENYLEDLKAEGITETKKADLKKKYLKAEAQLNSENTEQQLLGYAGIAGAMSSMFEQGSREAAAFQMIESALAVVAGVRAILTAGTGDPYTAIPRMIATTALVAQTLQSAGIAFSGSGSNGDYSRTVASANTTTVFGGGDDPSESLANSMDIVSDLAKPQFSMLSSMNKYLASIDANIRGAATDIIRTGEYALGVGAIEAQQSYVGTDIGGLISLGGGYNWQKLTGSGIAFGDSNAVAGERYTSSESYYGGTSSQQAFTPRTLEDTIENFAGLLFQSQAFESMSKKWYGSASYSYSSATTYQAMTAELENSLSRTFENIRDAIVTSSDTLGKDVEATLNNLVVDIGNVDLSGLSGDDLIEKLNNEFSAQADKFTMALYGTSSDSLSGFQDIGEGLFETLVRVSSGMEIAEYYLGKLGEDYESVSFEEIYNKKGEVSLEALKQSILEFEEAEYNVGNGVAEIVYYLQGSAEDLYDAYDILTDTRSQLEFLGISYTALTSSLLLGADGIENLGSALESFYDNFLSDTDRLALDLANMTNEFENLGLVVPTGVTGFVDLVMGIDTTTASGQELLGSVLLLSEGFADLTSYLKKALDAQVAYKLEEAELIKQIDADRTATLKQQQDDLSNFTIQSINNVLTTITGIRAKLTTAITGGASLSGFARAFEEFKNFSGDSDGLKDVLAALTAQSAALLDTGNFTSGEEMAYYQALANKQLGDVETSARTQLEALESIDSILYDISMAITPDGIMQVALVEDNIGLTDSVDLLSQLTSGDTLSNENELALRQSFTAESFITFNDELEDLRNNLAFLSLSTTDAGAFLQELAFADSIGYGNVTEFFNNTGNTTDALSSVFAEIAWNEVLYGAGVGDIDDINAIKAADLAGVYANEYANLFDFQDYFNTQEYATVNNIGRNTVVTDELLEAIGSSWLTENWSSEDIIEALQASEMNTIGGILDFFNEYDNYSKIGKLSDTIEAALNNEWYGDNDRSDKEFIGISQGMGGSIIGLEAWQAGMTHEKIYAAVDKYTEDMGLSTDALSALYTDYNTMGGRNVDNIASVLTSLLPDGSHADGLDYVPFDGYRAELHKGEQVLTAKERLEYRSQMNVGGTDNAPLISELKAMRKELKDIKQMTIRQTATNERQLSAQRALLSANL